MDKKLDLSTLTDEEAKHVWAVVQRDFDLRQKEEDRLGKLKTQIEKEDSKRELLGNHTSLIESHCIRCLQPFKFLVNSKHQCLDCQLYICRSCSHYNFKGCGWVCDPCHMTRVLKICTLEWYHEKVHARFKRFGSAKVMRSLYRRLKGQHSGFEHDLGGGYEEHSVDAVCDSLHYKEIKKVKRRLTVDPSEFDLGCNYFIKSSRRSNQATVSQDIMVRDVGVRRSLLAEADMASTFQQILEEQHKDLDPGMAPNQDDLAYSDNQTIPSCFASQLSYSSYGSGSVGGHQDSSSYLPSPCDLEEETGHCQADPHFKSHLGPCSHTTQHSLDSMNSTPQATPTPKSTSPLPQWEEEEDLEEQQLRQKLHEMTEKISDHSLSSDEDEFNRPHSLQEKPARRSPEGNAKTSKLPTRLPSRTSIVVSTLEEKQLQPTDSLKTSNSTESVERNWHPQEEGADAGFAGSTALLVELEDKVAQAAANIQNAQSEVSNIEDRIAALNAAGMPADKRKRSAIPVQARRVSQNFPTSQVDMFVRNTLYRGSLTQRNPVAKPKTKAACAV
uniref:RabBD domain-containing protein n=1 Tax=Monopterus albus TaxID=43700 RepID=A0A3Q3IHW2_MONAL